MGDWRYQMTTYVTRAQLQAMVDACPDTLAGKRDRLLLVVLRALGGRPREVAALRSLDVTGSISGWLTMSIDGQEIDVPVGEFTDHHPADLLIDWSRGVEYLVLGGRNPDDPLFLQVTKDDRLTTRGHSLGGLTPAAVSQIVKRAAERAGLPGTVTARSLRGPVRQKVGRYREVGIQVKEITIHMTWKNDVRVEVPDDFEITGNLGDFPEDVLKQMDMTGAELVDWH